MEALRSLIAGDLPPVGHPVILQGAAPPPTLPGYCPTWVDSGTSALALALLDTKAKRPDLKAPEVIIPAYCCPDLVAAAEFAGVIPVVVDVSPGDTAFNLHSLSAAITPQTLALVAMTFLGIRENWPQLLPFMREQHPRVALIEDNAQWFPDLTGGEDFGADYLVFSFGRGKPLSLLGGGALFSREQLSAPALGAIGPAVSDRFDELKCRAYNLLLQPNCYWFLNHNPLLHLGQTRFHELNSLHSLDSRRQSLLGSNFVAYRQRSRHLEVQYQQLLQAAGFQSSYLGLHTPRQGRLLRYPLLCANQPQRDALLHALNAQGLGASPLYQLPLAMLDGVASKIRQFNPPVHATDFAQRLITLPLHAGVREQHLSKIARVFSKLTNTG